MKTVSPKIIRHIALFMIFNLFTGTVLMAQINISGKVVDQNENPLVGVNVVIKGTYRGEITDSNGSFRFTVPGEDTWLIFSYIGFQTQEIQVENNRELQVVMYEKTEELEELVVIGYGTQKKEDISGAVAVLETEELEDLPIKSPAEALKGRISGVYVKSNTGQPGADPSVLIRGRTSISAGNAPLLVVDGIPGVSWSEIDFTDVTSMTVLKDAASSAIYGSSGANGVILITTKRGRINMDKISFSYSTSFSLPPPKLNVLNSEEALDLVRELNTNGDATAMMGDEYISSFMIDTANLYHTDWQDQIFRVGRSNNYSLSFSGGDKNLSYYISGGYLKDIGFVIPSDHERFTFRTNIDYDFSDRLKMSTDINFSRRSTRSVTTGNYAWNGASMLIALNTYPFLPIYDGNGGFFINPFQPNIDNPNASINGYYGEGFGSNLNIKYNLTYKIIDGLSFQFDLMNQIGFSKGSNYRSRYHTDVGRMNNGSAGSSAGRGTRWDVNNILRYTKSFGGHNLDLMGGFIVNQSSSSNYSSGRKGFPSDTITQVYIEDEQYADLGIAYSAESGINNYRKYSYIGRINYNYASRYILSLVVRSDGSSRFGSKSRWGTFPSASAGWRISKEEFMKNIGAISNLSIRYSIGLSGNDAFGNYLYASYYNPGQNHGMWNNDDVATGFSSLGGSAPNSDLRWEETFEQNLGLELGLWNNRIIFVGEVYNKDANDLLYNANLPSHTGFSSGWLNIGKVNTRGFDLQLTSHNISKSDFSWVSTFTISADRNEVLELGGLADQFRGDNIVRAGEPIDAIYGWVYDGIFQNQEEIDALSYEMPDGSTYYYQTELTAPGDIRFMNTDGYEYDETGELILDRFGNPIAIISADDRQIIGKPNPDFYYGIDNRIGYKNFEFSFFFQGVHGSSVLSLTRREIERMDNYFNYSAVTLNRWTYDGQDTDVPRSSRTDPNENNRVSTRWLEDASFLRLKYLTLTYSIPNRFIGAKGISNLTISLTAENLLTFTEYSLYDPEVASGGGSGVDMGGYPQARSFSLNVKLDF